MIDFRVRCVYDREEFYFVCQPGQLRFVDRSAFCRCPQGCKAYVMYLHWLQKKRPFQLTFDFV